MPAEETNFKVIDPYRHGEQLGVVSEKELLRGAALINYDRYISSDGTEASGCCSGRSGDVDGGYWPFRMEMNLAGSSDPVVGSGIII